MMMQRILTVQKVFYFQLMVKKQSTNVDAVSGATFSSNGIIKAVRNALSKRSLINHLVTVVLYLQQRTQRRKIQQRKYQEHTKMVFTKELEQDSEEDHCQCSYQEEQDRRD